MFDPEAFGAAMGDLIRAAVEPLEKRIDELQGQLKAAPDFQALVVAEVEKRVALLPLPKDGKDAEPIDKDALVKEVLAQIQTPSNGKDGERGQDGKSLTIEDVRPLLDDALTAIRINAGEAVQEAIKALPVPKDGKDGQQGEKGADGLGLAGAMIDREGALLVTLTNGEVKGLGVVVGKDGSNGRDGVDGIGLDSFDLEYLPETHEITVKASAAGRTKELRYPAGGIRPAGYWRDGTKAQAGEAWVHDGSLWIATKATSLKPESRSEEWIIAARRGRDGERGQKGADATPIAPIKLKD